MSDRLLNDDDLGLFFLVHRAIREDLEALPGVLARVGADQRDRIRAIARWFEFMARTVAQHHEGEDEWLYPLLAARDPEFAAARQRLETEHGTLDPAMDAIRRGLAALDAGTEFVRDRAELVARVASLRDTMRAHLEGEEAALVPAMKRHVTKRELDDFEREGARSTSLRDLSLALPWVIDAADARERAMLEAVLPWPVKLLYRLSWRRSYDRLVRPVRVREREAA